MEKKNETFHYTYSAKQQEEIKSIRQRYIPREENKMEQLRRLDESAQKPGTIASIALGTVSSLVMGVGMCCVLVWTHLFALGVVVGVVGMIGMGLAYPLFIRMTKKQREKITPEIMRLSDELMTQK